MAKVFISYRREDSLDVTDRLYERLTRQFGTGAVFRDMDNIPLGVDFRQYLTEAVGRCDVLLAVIGDRWLQAAKSDATGSVRYRLDDPRDFVRIEIESALTRRIPVIPVLVGRATIPGAAELPDALKDLAYRNAAEVRSGRDFHNHVDYLIQGLQRLFASCSPTTQRPAAEYVLPPHGGSSDPPDGVWFGIDLGTTYSSIAYREKRRPPKIAVNRFGERSTPSVVAFEPNGNRLVGVDAREYVMRYPERTVDNVKRQMGTEYIREIDGVTYSPTDFSAFILRELICDMEAQIGGPVERATISVPVAFSSEARRATIDAGRQAGLKEVALMTEPEATVLAFLLSREGEWLRDDSREHHVLVYDLGGGTFDVALIRYCRNEVRFIGTSGDDKLGGLDWDMELVNSFAGAVTALHGQDPRGDVSTLPRVIYQLERVKRILSDLESADALIQCGPCPLEFHVTRDEFVELTQHLVARTEGITEDLLRRHAITWEGLSVVLGTGGSTRMPMIRDMLARHHASRLHVFGPDENSVALGAAYHASAYRDACGKKKIARPVFA